MESGEGTRRGDGTADPGIPAASVRRAAERDGSAEGREPASEDPAASRPTPPRGGELWDQWKGFCIALLVGCVVVFAFEMITLIGALDDFEAGMEKGALWAMLLMIFSTLGVVVVIGGGLYRAIRRDRGRGGTDDGPPP